VEAPIREGFEIAPVWLGDADQWGSRPSLAVPDHRDSRPARFEGSFADFGLRQTEVVEAGTWTTESPQAPGGWRFYLWCWSNPLVALPIDRVEVTAHGAAIEIGAMCLGFADEHPLRPEPARVVVAEVPLGYAGDVDDLAIDVDRGSAGYTNLVVQGAPASDPLAAWGDAPASDATRMIYARVSSVPSGTVRVAGRDIVMSEARWSDLRDGSLGRGGSIRIPERGRNWVRVNVVDDLTGERMHCRVHFCSPDGVPYQPHGHPQHVNSNLGSWNVDVGSDVRLGRTTYAYIDGSCEGWLPRGPVRAQVSRGFEYQPLNDWMTVEPDTTELTLRVRRLFDSSKDRWFSGDTHVHFVSSFGALREAAAEGVSVVNLLVSQWGNLFSNAEDFLGRPVLSEDGKTVLYAAQENRQHFLGHLSLLGLKQPIMPWSTDGPEEAELGGALEATLTDWADRCRSQGGTVVVPHFPAPGGELAVLVATGRADAVEFGEHQERSLVEYYRYLNAGFRLPLAGGTDKMSNDVPIGLSRTYVRLDHDHEFGFEPWCQGLRAGRSYMTSGPLLEFTVDGAQIGDSVRLPEGGGSVAVQARARSIFPMFKLEVVQDGRVVASSESEIGVRDLVIDQPLRVRRGSWLCVRVGGGGPAHLTHHRDSWRRAIMAHSSPIYVACGDNEYPVDRQALEYTIASVERGRSYVTELAPVELGNDVRHHHLGDHRQYLRKPFEDAYEILMRRLNRLDKS
jgi:hypothetical protein